MAQRTEAKTNTEVLDQLKQAEAIRAAFLAEKREEDRRQGISRKDGTVAWRAPDVGPAAYRAKKR